MLDSEKPKHPNPWVRRDNSFCASRPRAHSPGALRGRASSRRLHRAQRRPLHAASRWPSSFHSFPRQPAMGGSDLDLLTRYFCLRHQPWCGSGRPSGLRVLPCPAGPLLLKAAGTSEWLSLSCWTPQPRPPMAGALPAPLLFLHLPPLR